MKDLIVISNVETGEYFFTTNHCQMHGLSNSFVPTTHYNNDKETVRGIFYSGEVYTRSGIFYKEIPNPDKLFQA